MSIPSVPGPEKLPKHHMTMYIKKHKTAIKLICRSLKKEGRFVYDPKQHGGPLLGGLRKYEFVRYCLWWMWSDGFIGLKKSRRVGWWKRKQVWKLK